MTTGERTFNTSTQQVVSPKATLIPPGTYGMTLGNTADIGCAKRPDAIPYINVRFEVEGTAASDGGKNRLAFHRLLLGLKPGKDGVLNPNRSNGITAMAKALGTELEGIEIIERTVEVDGQEVRQEYLNPKQVLEWVKGFAGAALKGRIKIQKGTAEYPDDKNEISAFMLPE